MTSLLLDKASGPHALRRAAPHHFTLSPRNDVLTDQQMTWLHPAHHNLTWRNPRQPLERDVLTDLDVAVLFHAHHDGSVSPDDRDSPEWATATAGVIDPGLLVHTESDTAVLADDVQYGLRLLDSDETPTY
ncbi:hypothetical protein OHA79_03385 [Streptomyces sp. NBC_00841]|uniref:hypothetical protein n=1 Tax=Streptomyces sp. NBC_00841 TaxID=2975847 RepID=UPI002DDA2621|nr:hypothetical protein [Streptomyces sp. NBC_00841]WRZ97053.1 hypothetical protein OHA79_03385 [Streptomyces sp. NBC_00841]